MRVGRVGSWLHKSLLPLGGKAVLSRLFELAPEDARLIVCVGNRAQQVRDYVELAHPDRDVTFVDVPGWAEPGSGPGRSLLAARNAVGDDDMMFTSCDTLCTHLPPLREISWAAYAPMPAGTEPQRWCRFSVQHDDAIMKGGGLTARVMAVLDKTADIDSASYVYTGLAYVGRHDLDTFWDGILAGKQIDDELQVTGGLQALTDLQRLYAQRIDWIDTGDETAYRRAVAQFSGYDWTKNDQATYVLPESQRVVKYMSDTNAILARSMRGRDLKHAVPAHVDRRANMLAYEYVDGETIYERLERADDIDVTRQLLEWRDTHLNRRVHRSQMLINTVVRRFYEYKTHARVALLRDALGDSAHDAVCRVDFGALIPGFEVGYPHGDFNYGNVIITPDTHFVGIDWREDFVGFPWFDRRYDVAKLLAGTVVHWGHARRGDFTPWDAGEQHAEVIRAYLTDSVNTLHDVEVIAALSLINSAPLHAEPLDEILVARGVAWLERLT
jgi:UTP-glucose-1-phosphate uridylyltransferase